MTIVRSKQERQGRVAIAAGVAAIPAASSLSLVGGLLLLIGP